MALPFQGTEDEASAEYDAMQARVDALRAKPNQALLRIDYNTPDRREVSAETLIKAANRPVGTGGAGGMLTSVGFEHRQVPHAAQDNAPWVDVPHRAAGRLTTNEDIAAATTLPFPPSAQATAAPRPVEQAVRDHPRSGVHMTSTPQPKTSIAWDFGELGTMFGRYETVTVQGLWLVLAFDTADADGAYMPPGRMPPNPPLIARVQGLSTPVPVYNVGIVITDMTRTIIVLPIERGESATDLDADVPGGSQSW